MGHSLLSNMAQQHPVRTLGRLLAERARQASASYARGGGGGGSSSGGGGQGGPPNLGKIIGGSGAFVVLVIGGITFRNCLFNVDGGHRAIKYSRLHGIKPEVYPEGTHLILPWFEHPIIYDVRAKPRNIASLTGTKDLQMVNITCRVLSRPAVPELATIYRELGTDYDERVLPSIVNEVLKSVIARAAFLVDQAIQEKQSIIVRAQGEAKSAELIGQAIKQNKGFLTLRRLEAAREIANVVSGSGNKVILDADSLLLNVNSDETYCVAEDTKPSKLRR